MSPELVLVDPDLAAAARRALPPPDDTLLAMLAPARPSRTYPVLPALTEPRERAELDEVGDARRRLTELSELEPPVNRRKRRTKVMSLVFAAAAWGALAIVAAETLPWRI